MFHDILGLIKKGFPGATVTTVLLLVVWFLVMPVISVHPTLMLFVSVALAICLLLAFIIALLGGCLWLLDWYVKIKHRHDHHEEDIKHRRDHHEVDIERKRIELEVRREHAKHLINIAEESVPYIEAKSPNRLLTRGNKDEES